jgi:hypothetical protein
VFSPLLARSHDDVELRANGGSRLGARGERLNQPVRAKCERSKSGHKNKNAPPGCRARSF